MSRPRHKSSSQPGADKVVATDASRRAKPPRAPGRAAKAHQSESLQEGRTLDLTQKISQSRQTSARKASGRKASTRKVPVRKPSAKSRSKKTAKAEPRTLADKLKFFGLCSVFAVVSVSLLTFTALSYQDYQLFQSQVEAKEARLGALQTQLDTGEKRLQALQHPKGREQLLNERGYVRPGERLLLFPATPEEKRQAAFVTNDLTPHLPETLVQNGDTGTSAWRRVANTLSGWWSNLRRASDTPTPLPIPPSEEKAKKKEVAVDVSTQNTVSTQDTPNSSESSDFSVEN